MTCAFKDDVIFYIGSVLSPFIFAVVVDVLTELARGCAK